MPTVDLPVRNLGSTPHYKVSLMHDFFDEDFSKMLVQFIVDPVLYGATIVSATLRLYASNGYSALSGISLFSNGSTGWSADDSVDTLNSVVLGSALQTFSLMPSAPKWVELDVKGDASKGVVLAAQSNLEYLLVAMQISGPTPRYKLAEMRIGDDSALTMWVFDDYSGNYDPHIRVVYEEAAPSTVWAFDTPVGYV